jgi:hypothetical protein
MDPGAIGGGGAGGGQPEEAAGGFQVAGVDLQRFGDPGAGPNPGVREEAAGLSM